MTERLLIAVRVDASSAMGLGHAARSTTLAAALADLGAEVEVIGSGLPTEMTDRPTERLRTIAIDSSTCVEDANCISTRRPDLAVVDGYHFPGSFFDALAADEIPYAVVDDNGDTPARNPLAVVNSNPHATGALYRHLPEKVNLLLGLDYALVRAEFEVLAAKPPPRKDGVVFVAMGGSDPAGLTVPITRAVAAVGRHVRVALGPSMAGRAAVVAELGGLDDVVVTRPDDYEIELATCELAVLAAGSSLWEAAVVRTPVVAVIVADNQAASARAASEQQFVIGCVDARGRVDEAALDVSLSVGRATGLDATPTRLSLHLEPVRHGQHRPSSISSLRVACRRQPCPMIHARRTHRSTLRPPACRTRRS